MTKTQCFFPDTNLLYNFVDAIMNHSNLKSDHRRSKDFWKQYGNKTRIPSIVWAEFSGLWFHKNIDLRDYSFWFNKRFNLFNEMLRQLKNNGVSNCDEDDINFQTIFSIATKFTQQKMPDDLIKKIVTRIKQTIDGCSNTIKSKKTDNEQKEFVKKNKERNEKILNNKKGKILDGLDSFIVAFAFEYSKKYNNYDIIIVSDDKFLVDTVMFFNESEIKLEDYDIPKNVLACTTGDIIYKKKFC